MSISAPGNIKEAIHNLMIESESNAHQIWYKPTQRKNSKAKKMFPGIPAGLCPKDIMHSSQHGLKKCEKTLCDAKKLQSRQIWIIIIFPSWLWMGILNRLLLLKWLRSRKVGSIPSMYLTNSRRMAARYLSMNTTPLITIGLLLCGIYLSIWKRWNKSLESGLKFKLSHLLVNGIPTQSQRLANIASITSIIALRFAKYSTSWLLTLTTLLCLQWQMALAHPMASPLCATCTLTWNHLRMGTLSMGYLYAWIMQLAGHWWILRTCVQTRKQSTSLPKLFIAYLHGGISIRLIKGILGVL